MAAVLGLLLSCSPVAAAPQELVIGVQNLRSAEQTRAAWQPTAAYLSRTLPDYRFRVEALDTDRLSDALARGRLDFVLANPSHYVYLEARHRIKRIATQVNEVGGHPLQAFGGVIFVRDRHPGIRSIGDLRGRRIAAVGPKWLGGYQAQAGVLLDSGIDPRRDVSIFFMGEPQDRVVEVVADGRADAGFVRSGILEALDREGRIRLADFRVLSPRDEPGFPLLLSTPLYPEWPFAVAPQVSADLAGRVALALLRYRPQGGEADGGRQGGWAIPADYRSVHELMRALHEPPYDTSRELTLREVFRQHEQPIALGLIAALLGALALVLRFQHLNRTVRGQVALITQRTDELEREAAARRAADERLRLAASVFDHANDGILITDADNRIIEVNEACTRVTGYAREEVLGRSPRILQSGRHDAEFYRAMWKAIRETGHWKGEIWNRRKDGEFYIELLDITAIRDERGEIARHVGVFSDITDLRKSQDKLQRLAHYDALTHLPNRALLGDRLEQAVAHADREGRLLAVCFLDLDGFKPVNDQYGHHVGDLLLMAVAERLKDTLRGADTVARLGGDEFVLLLSGIGHVSEIEGALWRVIEAIEAPVLIDGLELRVSASIGATIYPFDHSDPESLIRHADQAMYMAKRAGRGRYQLFDAMEHRLAAARTQELEQLRAALHNGEFVLHYQPKVDMRAGRVVGVEALIRWRHPDRGLLPPAEFLPLAESDGLILEIGEWVIAEALRQLQAWLEAGLPLTVSVNVSARQLQSPGFAEGLRRQLARHPGVDPRALELEILESTALGDMQGVREVIGACQGLGVTFALDDFGTGYSSLSHLRRLSIDTVKIDQSFIRELMDNPEDLAIVEGIVSLARIFQRRVVGEGVETPEHGVMLMRLGCDLAQGYGIARPMPAAEVETWCRRFKPDPQWAMWADVPWDYADFPLMVAQSDHNRWIKLIARHVEGSALRLQAREITDHHCCRFGRWYYGEGGQRYGHTPEFAEIEAIHIQVHRLGQDILQSLEQGRAGTARTQLTELYAQRDSILARLCALQMLAVRQARPDFDAAPCRCPLPERGPASPE